MNRVVFMLLVASLCFVIPSEAALFGRFVSRTGTGACTCVVRCCRSDTEKRSVLKLSDDMPHVLDKRCCGCTKCNW